MNFTMILQETCRIISARLFQSYCLGFQPAIIAKFQNKNCTHLLWSGFPLKAMVLIGVLLDRGAMEELKSISWHTAWWFVSRSAIQPKMGRYVGTCDRTPAGR